jgi:hypothetical protein
VRVLDKDRLTENALDAEKGLDNVNLAVLGRVLNAPDLVNRTLAVKNRRLALNRRLVAKVLLAVRLLLGLLLREGEGGLRDRLGDRLRVGTGDILLLGLGLPHQLVRDRFTFLHPVLLHVSTSGPESLTNAVVPGVRTKMVMLIENLPSHS